MFNSILIKRRLTGGAGAPSTLSGGELAFNEVDDTLYYGRQDGVIPIAGPGAFVSRTLTQDVTGSKTWLDTQYFSSDIDVTGTVEANTFKINADTVIDSNKDVTVRNINASGDLTVTGNLSVLGDVTSIETTTTVASAFSITNTGSGPALSVTQTGATDIAAFYDDANSALIIKDGGNVGINIATPTAKLHVDGTFLATGSLSADNGLIHTNGSGALTVNGATTLESTLDVTSAATFASSVSAHGALTVDGLATFNADVTVVDKLQVQSIDFDPGVTGTHVEVEGTNVKVVQCGATSVEANYGLNGISTANTNAVYTIATDNGYGIVINADAAASDIDLTGNNVNITSGDLEVQTGNLNGNGINYVHDFIIDGGTF
jgi:hypothetical protein